MAYSQNIGYMDLWRGEYRKWVCGFGNARGYIVYIGIGDAGYAV